MRKRIVIIAVNVAIVLAIAGGTAAYAVFDKTVTLSVDGKEKSVHTFGSQVSDVLKDQHIKLDEHDVVAPQADAAIEDGSRIAVRYGRKLTATIDGKKRVYWTTADNVSDALKQLGLHAQDARLSTSRSSTIPRSGLALRITRPKNVTIKADGHKKKIETVDRTVRAVLKHEGVTMDGNDEVSPKPSAKIKDKMTIDVTRIKVTKRTETASIDYDVQVREDDDMYEGDSKVVREGQDGEKKLTYRVVEADGKVRSSKLIDSKVTDEPVDQIEKHGTKEEPAPEPSTDSSDSSSSDSGSSDSSSSDGGSSDGGSYSGGSGVWDQIAECESGGDWSINTGNGYYGGLQFNESTWHAYGGTGLPSEHSREEQIAIAEKVRAATGGYGSWPACSSELGLPQ